MRRTLSFLLALILMLGMMPTAFAEDENAIVYNIRLLEGEDYAAQNMNRLRTAVESAEEGKSLYVKIVEGGTYYVGDGARAWRLRSNTTLDLNGATLIRYGSQGNLIQNSDFSGENGTIGGYDLSENITVKNGTLDGAGDTAASAQNLCNIGHAKGVHFDNMTFRNGTSHLVEFSGCRDCTITNCTFTGYTGNDDAVEALQFDISDNDVSSAWNGVYFSDSTVCRNMTVDNCTFLDFPSGVGNHKGILDNHNSGIVIKNSKFQNTLNTKQAAIWAYDFDDSEISGNTITGTYATGIYVSACRDTVIRDNTVNIEGVGMYITMANSYVRHTAKNTRQEEHCVNVTVAGNTVNSRGSNIGVRGLSGSGITEFSDNNVTSAGENAVTFSSSSTVGSVKNNTLKATAGIGLLLATSAQVNDVSGNMITAKDQGVQVTSDANVTHIRNNPSITSSTGNGIFVSNATAQNITGNTIKNCAGDGISVSSTGKTSAINSNNISGCTGYGVRVNNKSLWISFSNNAFANNKEGDYKVSANIILATPKISALSCAYGGVSIKWSKGTGAQKYRVFYKNNGKWTKLADTTAVSYVDATAASGTTRTYTVRCISADAKTYTSNYDTVGTSLYFVAAPRVSAIQNGNGYTQLTWAAVKGASKYRVFVKNGSSWKKLADTKATSYKNTAVKGGTAYTYTVRAMDGNGKFVSAYNTAGWSYTYIAPPALPTLKNTKNGVQLSFTKPAGGSYLRIFRKTGSGGWAKLADTSATSYVDKTAKNGVKYAYTLRCINKGGTKYFSGYNTTGKAITCKH